MNKRQRAKIAKRTICIFNSLADIFAEKQYIKVEEISSGDLFGYCRVRCSDGYWGIRKMPLIGDVVKIIKHSAQIFHSEHSAEITVKQWSGKEFKLTPEELKNLVQNTSV